ncbi:hypothetical protein ScPMuIL_008811 [Solemya velum]
MDKEEITTMKGDISEFAEEMKKLIINKEFSDIKFLVGPHRKTIYAHRCILSSRCQVFKAMFAEQAQKNGMMDKDVPFVLSDMSPDVFIAMIEFIYTNCVTLTPSIAVDVLATSLEYGLDALKKLCVEYLSENVRVNNACEMVQAGVTYGQEKLVTTAVVFIEHHTEDTFKSKGFEELSGDALSQILLSEKLTLDELEIVKHVRQWAAINSVVLSKPISEVAQSVVIHLRLPLLSPEELEHLEQENQKDNFIPVENFNAAWRLHALRHGDPVIL